MPVAAMATGSEGAHGAMASAPPGAATPPTARSDGHDAGGFAALLAALEALSGAAAEPALADSDPAMTQPAAPPYRPSTPPIPVPDDAGAGRAPPPRVRTRPMAADATGDANPAGQPASDPGVGWPLANLAPPVGPDPMRGDVATDPPPAAAPAHDAAPEVTDAAAARPRAGAASVAVQTAAGTPPDLPAGLAAPPDHATLSGHRPNDPVALPVTPAAATPNPAHRSAETPPSSQIATAAIRLAAAGGARTVTVRLAPAELGHVEVRLHRGEQANRATLAVERPETLALLRRDEPALRAALDRSGLFDTAPRVTLQLAPAGEAAASGHGAPPSRPPPDSDEAGPGGDARGWKPPPDRQRPRGGTPRAPRVAPATLSAVDLTA